MFLKKILSIKKEEIKKIEKIIKNINEIQIEKRSLIKSLSNNNRMNIIAEIKRSSPSLGIIKHNLNIEKIALSYQKDGALAISIITDKTYFSGSWQDIMKIKK